MGIYAGCSAPDENEDYDYSVVWDEYTFDECKRECSKADFCTAFSYEEHGNGKGDCWYYHYNVDTAQIRSGVDMADMKEMCLVKQMDSKPYHSFYGLCRKNEDLDATTDISTHDGVSKDECKAMCTADDACEAYQYSPSKEVCKINYSVINFIQEAADPDTVCITKFQVPPPQTQYRGIYGICGDGSDPATDRSDWRGSYSLRQCMEWCNDEGDKCHAYEYNDETRTCTLMFQEIHSVSRGNEYEIYIPSNPTTGQMLDNYREGFRFGESYDWTCSVKRTDDTKWGHRFYGACVSYDDPKKEVHERIPRGECKAKCIADNYCLAFQYGEDDLRCELYFDKVPDYLQKTDGSSIAQRDDKTTCVIKW